MDRIGIIGLGYVGLPLAVEFGKVMDVVGFDINKERIDELKKGFDRTREVEKNELEASTEPVFLLRKRRSERCQLFYYHCANTCR